MHPTWALLALQFTSCVWPRGDHRPSSSLTVCRLRQNGALVGLHSPVVVPSVATVAGPPVVSLSWRRAGRRGCWAATSAAFAALLRAASWRGTGAPFVLLMAWLWARATSAASTMVWPGRATTSRSRTTRFGATKGAPLYLLEVYSPPSFSYHVWLVASTGKGSNRSVPGGHRLWQRDDVRDVRCSHRRLVRLRNRLVCVYSKSCLSDVWQRLRVRLFSPRHSQLREVELQVQTGQHDWSVGNWHGKNFAFRKCLLTGGFGSAEADCFAWKVMGWTVLVSSSRPRACRLTFIKVVISAPTWPLCGGDKSVTLNQTATKPRISH